MLCKSELKPCSYNGSIAIRIDIKKRHHRIDHKTTQSCSFVRMLKNKRVTESREDSRLRKRANSVSAVCARKQYCPKLKHNKTIRFIPKNQQVEQPEL